MPNRPGIWLPCGCYLFTTATDQWWLNNLMAGNVPPEVARQHVSTSAWRAFQAHLHPHPVVKIQPLVLQSKWPNRA